MQDQRDELLEGIREALVEQAMLGGFLLSAADVEITTQDNDTLVVKYGQAGTLQIQITEV